MFKHCVNVENELCQLFFPPTSFLDADVAYMYECDNNDYNSLLWSDDEGSIFTYVCRGMSENFQVE